MVESRQSVPLNLVALKDSGVASRVAFPSRTFDVEVSGFGHVIDVEHIRFPGPEILQRRRSGADQILHHFFSRWVIRLTLTLVLSLRSDRAESVSFAVESDPDT